MGQELVVTLDEVTRGVVIAYNTKPEAAALQWLSPEQTAGKVEPFLFTQSQAILARTWVPCQDGPGVRMTYSADIRVKPGLMALMSASNPTQRSANGAYSFEMRQAIPSYLLALAVGDIDFASVGARSGVYAEPSVLKKAAKELEDTENMIVAAERLYGPYRWDRYDVIILPPSFPFGGMENPRLTFATPTILAGDKSLVSLVAHELAHSWSGNLVTNAVWSDFWLNEGFTSYFEGRIMEAVYGRPYADMLATLAMQDLRKTVDELGPTHADTRLKIDLTGRNPDDGVTDIAYVKGAFFLRHCEEVAGRERWDAFLRSWFDEHAFTSATSESFGAFLKDRLVQGDSALAARIAFDEWVYGTGLPYRLPDVRSDEFAKVDAAVAAFVASGDARGIQTRGWTTHHWLHFLRGLAPSMTTERMQKLDARFSLTRTGNSEILFEWLLASIKAEYAPAGEALERFLTEQGRRKFLRPLYAELVKTPEGKERAKRIYEKARPGYHSVSTATIDEIVK
jgi:aminopeptidase N